MTLGPLIRFIEASTGDVRTGDWRSQPIPPPQEAMPAVGAAPPNPAVAGITVPQPFTIRDARTLDVPAGDRVGEELMVLGFPLATTWWGVLIGLYAYALPLVLYTA